MDRQDVPTPTDVDAAFREPVGGLPAPPHPARLERGVDPGDGADGVVGRHAEASNADGDAEPAIGTHRQTDRIAAADAVVGQPVECASGRNDSHAAPVGRRCLRGMDRPPFECPPSGAW